MSKNMKELPGTPLSGKELKSDKVITFKWRPNAKYAWSAGIAYGRFLDELMRVELLVVGVVDVSAS